MKAIQTACDTRVKSLQNETEKYRKLNNEVSKHYARSKDEIQGLKWRLEDSARKPERLRSRLENMQREHAMKASGQKDRLKELEDDPRLFLYTSLTAGSSHIITATSRMETILNANRIPFQAIDIATDEKTRMIWGRRAGKDESGRVRKLPGLVQEGLVLGVSPSPQNTPKQLPPPLFPKGNGSRV